MKQGAHLITLGRQGYSPDSCTFGPKISPSQLSCIGEKAKGMTICLPTPLPLEGPVPSPISLPQQLGLFPNPPCRGTKFGDIEVHNSKTNPCPNKTQNVWMGWKEREREREEKEMRFHLYFIYKRNLR